MSGSHGVLSLWGVGLGRARKDAVRCGWVGSERWWVIVMPSDSDHPANRQCGEEVMRV